MRRLHLTTFTVHIFSLGNPMDQLQKGVTNPFLCIFNQDGFKIKRFFHFITQSVLETVHTGVMNIDELLI